MVKSISNIPMAWINDLSANKPKTVIFTSGDDIEAKRVVIDLLNEMGFAAIDLGSLREGGALHEVGAPPLRTRPALDAAAPLTDQSAHAGDPAMLTHYFEIRQGNSRQKRSPTVTFISYGALDDLIVIFIAVVRRVSFRLKLERCQVIPVEIRAQR